MVRKIKKSCKEIFGWMLILCAVGTADAQSNFNKADDWLAENAPLMGGRVILMVYQDGKIVHTKAVNDMSRRQKAVGKFIARRQGKEADTDPFTTATRQPVASCSKWFSAALVMSFVDEGKLNLEDTVGKWLPVLALHGKGNITISQCLSHLTGIKAPPLKESLSEMKSINSMDEAIEKIAILPMEGRPGKIFHYSNTRLQIAGAVIEKISGKSFETLFAERIAKPVEMKNTDFGKGKVAFPAGGASSTPEDYLNFLAMILDGGTFQGKRILSENSIAQMQINRITKDVTIGHAPAEAGDFGYGFGEWVMGNAGQANGSKPVTSPGLFGSFPWVDNEKKYAAFMMAFYLKPDGRNERYKELKQLLDEAVR